MRKIYLVAITVVLASVLMPAAEGAGREGSNGNRLLLGPAVCLPPDSFEVNPALSAPAVTPLSEYTGHLGPLQVDWEPEVDANITHYWVVSSDSPAFGSVLTCSLWDSDVSTCAVHISTEDTLYCRVYSVDELGRISPPGETVSTVADTTAPEITSLGVNGSAGGGNWVSQPGISISYQAGDNSNSSGAALIRISERDSTFSGITTDYNTDSFTGTIEYRLSAGYERKLIYASLVDRAGNMSSPYGVEVMYEEGAHCYPNPFNPERGEKGNIVFRMGGSGPVRIYLYDRFGNLVLKKTVSGSSGWNEFSWNGRNRRGAVVANGGYICVIKGEREHKCKVAVLK